MALLLRTVVTDMDLLCAVYCAIDHHSVTLLEEYVPSEAEKKNYMLFARGVRAKMHEYLSKSQYVEITDHS